jgi:hypothetical protein
LCGGAIDMELTFPHPMSWSADHVDPVGQGGDNNGELRAAHLLHNQQRNRKHKPIQVNHARTW